MSDEIHDKTPAFRQPVWKRAIWWLLAAGPTVIFAIMAWRQRWMSDDGFINIRVVEHLLAGNGPVFNAGERVEAYTSALWVGLVSLAGMVGAPLEWAAVLGGIALSVSGMGLACLGAMWLHTGDERSRPGVRPAQWSWMLPVGALVYAVVPPAWDFASSGLETGLALFWLGASSAVMARLVGLAEVVLGKARAPVEVEDTEDDAETGEGAGEEAGEETGDPGGRLDGLRLAAGALVGLGPLIRPELTLFSVGWLVLILFADFRTGRFDWKRFGTLTLTAGLVPVSYQLFRMGYFSAMVPNTAFAKSAFESRWHQGWLFARNFFGFYLLALPLALGFVAWVGGLVRRFAARRWMRAAALVIPVVCGIGYGLYVAKVGGGFMHGRLWLPVLFGLLLPGAMVPVRTPLDARGQRVQRAAAALVVVAWAVACGVFFRIPEENKWGIGDERNWYSKQAKNPHPVTVEGYRKMYFHAGARRVADEARRICPSAFDDQPGVAGDCERFVYVDLHNNGALYPWLKTFPLSEAAAERGIVYSVLRGAIGMRGLVFGLQVHLADRVGLADPVASRLELSKRGRPGHEKMMNNAWYVGRLSKRSAGEPAQVTAARAATKCGELGELLAAIHEPLGPGRFLGNIWRAVALHDLKIPSDPWKGYYKFCEATAPYTERAGGTGGDAKMWRCPLGKAVSRVEVGYSAGNGALARVRPWCRPLSKEDHTLGARDEAIHGPSLGGNGGGLKSLECPDGELLVGLGGRADDLVQRLYGLCLSAETVADGSVEGISRTATSVGRDGDGGEKEGGEEFTVRCPKGQVVQGLAGRSGALVDAVGVVCKPVGEVDTL